MSNHSGPPTSPADDSDWDALSRYLAGESDPAESRAVEAWLETRPADASLAKMVAHHAARAGMYAEVQVDAAVDVNRALAAVQAMIMSNEPTVVTASTAPRLTISNGGATAGIGTTRDRTMRDGVARDSDVRRANTVPLRSVRVRGWQIGALASAAALLLVVLLSRRTGNSENAEQREFATKVGARDSVRLADGSRVILAPGSSLTVAAGYGSSTRDVTLVGAAFFDVQHDAAHPFTVHVNGAEIQDIGTAFSVKTGVAGAVSVAVTRGSVALRGTTVSAPAPVELKAGDRGVMDGQKVAVTRGSVTDEDVAWTRGVLAYRDAPMSEVQADMRRWYGIDLRLVGTELTHRTLKASFRADSAGDAVHVIALALGADVVQRGDTVILQMAGHSTTP